MSLQKSIKTLEYWRFLLRELWYNGQYGLCQKVAIRTNFCCEQIDKIIKGNDDMEEK